jgi:hypothetical protein
MKRAVVPLSSAMVAALAAACSSPDLPTVDIKDPQACQACHPDHFAEWSGSMHAYASEDPLFLAMNARAQRETQGAVGGFCVKCHAPVALAEGATKDGTNLASLPASLRGVTCYFCHAVSAVNGTHDNPLTLAKDSVLRGGIKDPVENNAHASAYSPLHDRADPSSASLCGSCHDIINPLGAHIERTYAEWKGTLFSHTPLGLSCGQCHMDGRDGVAAKSPDGPARRVHSHLFAGADLALTSFPQAGAQRSAVQDSLDTTLQAALCVKGTPGQATIQVVLDNVGAGHSWPSGATQDRRAWVELTAYASGQVVYQSGAVPDGQSVLGLADPDLWLIRDCLLDGQGKEVHMFWQAASYDSNQLPGPKTNVQTDPQYYLTHVMRAFPRPTSTPAVLATMPDRVTMRVRLVPVGYDVIDDLIQSGDLDASIKAKMPTLTLAGTMLEWTPAAATIKYAEQGLPVSCVSVGLPNGASGATPAAEHMACKP